MKKLQFSNFHEWIRTISLDEIDEKNLFIFDIDGVFFSSFFRPRTILGIIDNSTLDDFSKILGTNAACWIMTNRYAIFKYFPFIKQLSKAVQSVTSKAPDLYSNCSDFLASGSNKYNIIMNAKKPKSSSQDVLKRGVTSFYRVYYIGGRDTPFYFTDEELVDTVEKQIPLDNLTFIEIT